MKKAYVRPVMSAELFAANEHVAACWSIHCNVPLGVGYRETNGIAGYQEGGRDFVTGERIEGDQRIASGSGCGTTHEVNGISAAGPSANAKWETASGEVLDVFYFKAWVHGARSDHFCTLDAVRWEKNPNASN